MNKPAWNKRICVDFDDTLVKQASYPDDGEPLAGATEALMKLRAQGFWIIIYTCRVNPEMKFWPDIITQMIRILAVHNIPYDEVATGCKPIAFAYIDDKGIYFTDWDSAYQEVLDREALFNAKRS